MVQGLNEDVWNGYQALKSLAEQAPIPSLKAAAKDLHSRLSKTGRGGPIAAFIATRGDAAVPQDILKAMDRFLEEANKASSSYEQPAFQCLDEFGKAVAEGKSRVMAGFALAICLAERVFSIRIKLGD